MEGAVLRHIGHDMGFGFIMALRAMYYNVVLCTLALCITMHYYAPRNSNTVDSIGRSWALLFSTIMP